MNDQTNRSRMGLTNEGGGVCQPASADTSMPSLATLRPYLFDLLLRGRKLNGSQVRSVGRFKNKNDSHVTSGFYGIHGSQKLFTCFL